MKYKPMIVLLLMALCLSGSIMSGKPSTSQTQKIESLPGKIANGGNTRDSDRDGLTDEIEVELGTNPNNRDTDYDGLTDGYELSYKFAVAVGALSPGKEKEYSDVVVKVDRDKDNIHAALDSDDNNNGVNDGDEDSDGDGVPNKLEYYGYYYDSIKGKFMPWYTEDASGIHPGDPNTPHFFTDSTQWSTDQDPYSDGTEVSNVGMDPSVPFPANHPLIPAYPDIYMKMTSYDVSPIAQITTGQGKQTQEAWQNTTTDEENMEHHWDVKAGMGIQTKAGLIGSFKTTYSAEASGGGRYGSSHSVTKSTSGFQQDDWNSATTIDMNQAANLTLKVNLANYGTAQAWNIIPELNLCLGDRDNPILTYQVSTSIDNLAPGGHTGVFVIGDQVDHTITLNMDQLQKIQMGVPLILDIFEMDAEVKRQDGKGGWTDKQEWCDYKSSIDAVCAHMTIDNRNGSPLDYLVYATNKKNGPEVKVKDILSWILGEEFNILPDGKFEIYGVSCEKWAFGFSESAFKNIKDQLELDNNILEVIVYQCTTQWDIAVSMIKETDPPTIHWTYYKPDSRTVSAYVTDYFGIESVKLITTDQEITMEKDQSVSCIYTYTLPEEYNFGNNEKINAINVNQQESSKDVSYSKTFGNTWAIFRHDTAHTGRSQFKGVQKGKQKWAFPTDSEIYSSPAISVDGTIYVISSGGNLYALNKDGTERWEDPYKIESNGKVSSSPAIGMDGTIYVGSDNGNLYAINPDGSEKWKYQTNNEIYSSPNIGPKNGYIYVGSCDNKIYAIDPSTGSKKYEYQTGDKIIASPAIHPENGNVYVGSNDSYLYFLTPELNLIRKVKIGYFTFPMSSPAIGSDDVIYVGSQDSYLYAIQPNGEERFSPFQTGKEIKSSPAIGLDGAIYVGSCDNKLYAISDGGEKNWEYAADGCVSSSPAIGSDGTIYVGSEDTYIYAINPIEGTQKWSWKTGGPVISSPAIGPDGTIYVGSNDCYLYAIEEK